MDNEELQETQDSEQYFEEDTTLENELEDSEPEQEDSSSKLKEVQAQKKHWRSKAKKLEDQLTKLKGALEEPKPQKEEPVDNVQELREEVVDIKLSNKGFDEETVKFIKTYAKGAGQNPMAVLEDAAIKSYIESKQAQAKLEDAIPAPSNRSFSVDGKTFKDMSMEERKANFEKVMHNNK